MRTDTTIQFKETVIVVTGASRGLGLRMAAALVDRGVTVVCSARSEDALERAVAELADAPGEALAIPADVREEADVTALFDDVDAAYGGADVLINNAGVNDAGLSSGEKPPVHELPTWLWDTILDTNLRGAILSSRAALHGMLERDRGVLLHLSSSMGLKGRANRAASTPPQNAVSRPFTSRSRPNSRVPASTRACSIPAAGLTQMGSAHT